MAAVIDQQNSAQSNDGNGIRYQASNGNFKAAVQFTPTVTAKLIQVDFCIGLLNSNPGGGGNVWGELWSDNGSNKPNAIIGSASNTQAASTITTAWGSGGGGQIMQFTWNSGSEPGLLTSGTKYWLVFNGDYPTTGVTNQIIINEVSGGGPLGYVLEDAGWSTAVSPPWFKEYYNDTTVLNRGGAFLNNFM